MRTIILILFATVSMCGALFAAEPAPTPKPSDKAATADKAPAAPAADDAAAEQDEDKAAAAKQRSAESKPSPQRFVPSEQVRADFDVSFPIDI